MCIYQFDKNTQSENFEILNDKKILLENEIEKLAVNTTIAGNLIAEIKALEKHLKIIEG